MGLPLGGTLKSKVFWDPMVEKVARRLDGWKKACLSLGGIITFRWDLEVESFLGSDCMFFGRKSRPSSVICFIFINTILVVFAQKNIHKICYDTCEMREKRNYFLY